MDDEAEQLIHDLRNFAKAYPEKIFTPLTDDERAEVSDMLITRLSAEMGRHFGPWFTKAADAIERLSAAAPRQAEGWQSIETAPKDGRLLLLYCDYGDGEREMYIAHYVIPIAAGGKFGPFIWKTQGSGGVAEKIPTHWMPLPDGPAGDGEPSDQETKP